MMCDMLFHDLTDQARSWRMDGRCSGAAVQRRKDDGTMLHSER